MLRNIYFFCFAEMSNDKFEVLLTGDASGQVLVLLTEECYLTVLPSRSALSDLRPG